MDLAQLTQASGILTYRGLTLESKEGITIEGELSTFDIPIDGISEAADERVTENMITLKVTPSGEWTSPEILLPYLAMAEGQFVLPVVPSSIDTGTDVLTAAGHPFVAGDRVLVGIKAGGTLPTIGGTAIDQDTYYYVGTVTTSSYKLYTSRANALSETSAVNFDAAGSDVRVVAQYDLVLNLVDGRQITFHAAAITEQPELDLQAEATPFGAITWKAFCRSRMQPDDANSFYTEASVAFPGWSASSSDIKTQSQLLAWADQIAIEDIDGDTEVLTATAHGLTTGDKVYPGTSGTFPTAVPALDADTPLWVNVADADTFTLHPTAASAGTGTSDVTFSAAGTGVLFLTKDNPPFTLQETEAGVKVKSNLSLSDRKSDRSGLYNQQFGGCRLEVTLIPLTVSGSQILTALKLQGTGAARGRSLNSGSKPLTIFSSGMLVRVNGAQMKKGAIEQSMKNTEAREVTFVNTRVVTAGVKQPPGYVATDFAGTDTTFTEA
jgi:hypothetical protein